LFDNNAAPAGIFAQCFASGNAFRQRNAAVS
jgi:hypothetical protein